MTHSDFSSTIHLTFVSLTHLTTPTYAVRSTNPTYEVGLVRLEFCHQKGSDPLFWLPLLTAVLAYFWLTYRNWKAQWRGDILQGEERNVDIAAFNKWYRLLWKPGFFGQISLRPAKGFSGIPYLFAYPADLRTNGRSLLFWDSELIFVEAPGKHPVAYQGRFQS